MATIKKRGSSWQAQVFKMGVRTSKTFPTKAAAQAWASIEEANIIAGKNGIIPNKTFGELLDEYARRVSPTKRGERWEKIRIELIKRDAVASVHLSELNASHFAEWRDRRLQSVTAASVRREWALLSNALNVAASEWKWLPDNPMSAVKKPRPAPPRDRRISQEEIDRLMHAFGADLNTVMGRVGQAFLFAIETAMRAGEIAALTWDNVKRDRRYCIVPSGKTEAAKRDVPLSSAAIAILDRLEGLRSGDQVFQVSTQQIDVLFRRAKEKALIQDLHFHDTRHEAITRLAQKLDVLDLARMVGHRDLRMLQVYYNKSAEDMAGKLD